MHIFITIIDGLNEGVFSTEADAMEFLDTYVAKYGTPESAEIENWIVGGAMVGHNQVAG